jgi:hypothetical protein
MKRNIHVQAIPQDVLNQAQVKIQSERQGMSKYG